MAGTVCALLPPSELVALLLLPVPYIVNGRERETSMKRCVGLLASQEVVKEEESRVKRRLPQNENPLDIMEGFVQ